MGQNYCFAEAGTSIATTQFEKSSILAEMGDQLGKEDQSGGTVDWPQKHRYQLGWVILADCRQKKSDNLQYDVMGRWIDCLIDQASDGPSIILIN